MAKVVGFEPTITVLETVALVQAKLHQHWRKEWDSNPRKTFAPNGFQDRPNKPDSGILPLFIQLVERTRFELALHRLKVWVPNQLEDRSVIHIIIILYSNKKSISFLAESRGFEPLGRC